MKYFFISLSLLIILSTNQLSYSQVTPTYNLTARNFQSYNDSLTFDVYILHTNFPLSDFGFMGITAIFNFNPAVANGGDLSFTYSERSSSGFYWVTPQVFLSPGNNQLRFAGYLGVTGYPPQISNTGLGTLICKMKLKTSALYLNHDSLNLNWRGSSQVLPYTRIFAWVGFFNTEITSDSSHFIDFLTSVIEPISTTNVIKYFLNQNYPNPFNPTTKINYSIPNTQYTILKVYDVLGNEIATLVNEKQNAGSYSVVFDGSNYPSGIYYYHLVVHSDKLVVDSFGEAGNFSEVKKMILIK
ncbi:MAG: T9SS type A sorting domain-containing protein [Ignavibacteria bacterium]